MHILRLFFVTLLSVFVLSGFALADQTQFFSVVKDLPLMDGMEEVLSETYVFDKPQGRVIGVSATMSGADFDQVLAFYRGVLPEFGWQAVSGEKTAFVRENEHLMLSFERVDGVSIAVFRITPVQ